MAYHSSSWLSADSSEAGLEALVLLAGFEAFCLDTLGSLVALDAFVGLVLRGSWVDGPAILLEVRVVWGEWLEASSGIGV